MNSIFQVVIFVLMAYLIGSIPTGFIIVKLFTGQDIRTIGSGSTGATNVKRVMGKKWFFIGIKPTFFTKFAFLIRNTKA